MKNSSSTSATNPTIANRPLIFSAYAFQPKAGSSLFVDSVVGAVNDGGVLEVMEKLGVGSW